MMTRRIYAGILFLFTPLLWIFTGWRGWRRPPYGERWWERFGWGAIHHDRPLWIHAVSVGETIAAVPLVQALHKRKPQLPILVTSTTPTGAEIVAQRLGTSVRQHYMPYDTSAAMRRFLQRQQPRLCLLMETEIWPNLCYWAARFKVPVLLINARMSQRSLKGYGRFAALFRPALASMSAVAAQSPEDAEAFRQLGAARVVVIDNIKYDLPEPLEAREKGREWRQKLATRQVWVFASTHAGEEKMAIAVLKQLRIAWPHLLLVLIPRHPHRSDAVEMELQAAGVLYALRSRDIDVESKNVLLVDTLGEVMDFYAAADLVTVGGSFVPVGGHNPLEAAVLSCPIVFGPHMENFRRIARDMLDGGAAVQVDDADALAQQLAHWLRHPEIAQEQGSRALAFVQKQRGSLEKILQLLDDLDWS
ncbi:lipid IV(A) 3-deoxy-D-manno-octulosonic acid transferase [Acidithiobacillus sp. M4-SHS-6]|uniref:lipid IV(A) 3-deoxy-D-manno-octulosonic acid transferase n=1 Tax=Acidithiobacillus sp. M4-SHS-6 TaxID=3383024 RepID=UPI0039BE4F7C